ncbi:esterase [Balneolaceae bacterium YR4-1]|uniref:Esterase n=1 Tax=Halalkalibaculum roseum TaxID=2709311 RepID=A0A6M1SZS3_9BACT|nr:alpha/beta hydrolase-fold protein [Halalkalibaculum roseum]NGP77386.1 esterase [Halalkalibaculum roseum]
MNRTWKNRGIVFTLALLFVTVEGFAQGNNNPPPKSPEVHGDQRVTFRIQAPNADSVKLSSSDIPGSMFSRHMAKNKEGVWELTSDVLAPGAYRYRFEVNGISVIDPRNTSFSESNENIWSLVTVPGNPMMDTRDVPHGAVAEVTYHSESLDRFRRMHVYTPPGYESGEGQYPVFYLLHGAYDSDDAWSTVGRAGFILDNLIAEGKAKPMIVVMPDGHTGPFGYGDELPMDEFIQDFKNDIKPYVESHYRVKANRENRAMAGLSMGGAHTLGIAIPNLDEYAYIGVFSSGVFGLVNNDGSVVEASETAYVKQNSEVLSNDDLKEGLELFWFATGKEDFLLDITRATVTMFEDYDFDVVYEETEGAHTWLVWRDYLIEFTPKLFK